MPSYSLCAPRTQLSRQLAYALFCSPIRVAKRLMKKTLYVAPVHSCLQPPYFHSPQSCHTAAAAAPHTPKTAGELSMVSWSAAHEPTASSRSTTALSGSIMAPASQPERRLQGSDGDGGPEMTETHATAEFPADTGASDRAVRGLRG